MPYTRHRDPEDEATCRREVEAAVNNRIAEWRRRARKWRRDIASAETRDDRDLYRARAECYEECARELWSVSRWPSLIEEGNDVHSPP